MVSSLLFINFKGDILIYRSYKDDVSRAEVMQFCNKIVATREAKENPIIRLDNVNYIHTTTGEITLLATTKSNSNVALILQFLYQVVTLCKAYFGGEFNESQIRKNFVLIYELLDEIMDFGLPQILDPDVLKLYITQGGIKKELDAHQIANKLKQVTGIISWRPEGIKHRKNELWIDVIESINLLQSTKGNVLRADVSGNIEVKCQLSGMPECKFGMNDKVMLTKEKRNTADGGIQIDDLKLHHCVRLGAFEQERAITFVPPEGCFTLMSYRINNTVNLPFKILPVVNEYNRNRIEATVKVKAVFDNPYVASNVVLKVPLPKNTAKTTIYSTTGKAKYEAEHSAVVWRIKTFRGREEFTIKIDAELSSSSSNKAWSRPPISMDFKIPQFTGSGMRVRYLKVVEKADYVTTKWIRYISQAGLYQHRI